MNDTIKEKCYSLAVSLSAETRRNPDEFAPILVSEADRCGIEAVEEKVGFLINSGKISASRSPSAYLKASLKGIPAAANQPIAQDMSSQSSPSIAQEIEQEAKDEEKFRKVCDFIAKLYGVEPNYTHKRPDNLEHISEWSPYRKNTWVTVQEEARARGTSMHQICREKGLNYGSLIQ